MDENGSPQQVAASQNGYNRLTTLEMESHPLNQTTTRTGGESALEGCWELHHQMESECNMIDWDRVFMAAFVTISFILILAAFFFPSLKPKSTVGGGGNDDAFQHEFVLDSLTISELKLSSAHVTGRCEAVLNISNLGDRSLYHENSVMSIFLDHELLWVTRTGDFFLEAGNGIVFNVTINTTMISVPASFVPTALIESQTMHKPLHFKLKYDGMLREGMDAWHEERYHVYVVCGWIKMQFVSETRLEGGSAGCSFENF